MSTKPTCASSSQLTPDPEVLPPINLESLPSQAHADIETHREIRALARKAAWEMPLLGSLSKPFTPPTQATPLRWRYTTYMGEAHPASKKVVVEFAPADLPDLNEKQKLKLIKLAGARWSYLMASLDQPLRAAHDQLAALGVPMTWIDERLQRQPEALPSVRE